MDLQRYAGVAQGESDEINEIDRGLSEIPPWLFKRHALEETLESSPTIDQKYLTNILNFIHFMDRCVYVHLLHIRYGGGILLKAYPEPCLDNEFTCRWDEERISGITLEHYQFLNILIDDGKSLILIPAVPQSMDKKSFTIQIPEKSYIVGYRQERRYPCNGIFSELIQNGFQAFGELVDFNPIGFRVNVTTGPFSSFRWLNLDESIHVNLMDNRQTIYSGVCRIIRHVSRQQGMEIILFPVSEGIKRFKKKQARNIRQRLVPSPSLIFNHPLLKKRIQLDVHDISTSGFSIYEEEGGRVLMPGMIIPGLNINFSGILNISCTAQVIYHLEEEGRGSRYGLAILDMDINSYSRLTQILTNVLEPHSYLSSEVDMNALWEFFFDTDFLYPKKYRIIQSHREAFKETYRKLYQENPEIAKHFTYQKNGRIYGHISMIRAYERAWMMHHHAARAHENRIIGFIVLKQLMHYVNDLHRLPSAKMDYFMSYFRPENRFPDRVFGGFARELENRHGCSMDLFAYLPHTGLSLSNSLPEGWSLRSSSALDIWDLKQFYEKSSGGLLLDALGLDKENTDGECLEDVYKRLGFLRRWRVFSLTYKGEQCAVMIIDQSDLGINLSELLNCIKIIVTKPEELSRDVLLIAVSNLIGGYKIDRVPVMFYPLSYVIANEIPYEKQYQLWIFNADFTSDFIEYMRKRFRIGYK
ncbi:hypothetical protein JXL19_03630 [bacterium]|nr:hypothetical protein [bacterium]